MIKFIVCKPEFFDEEKDELVALEKEIFRDINVFSEEDFRQTFTNRNAFNILVYDTDKNFKLVAYLMSERLSDSNSHKGMKFRNQYYYLESIAVLPEYQNKRIGFKLFQKFINHCKLTDCKYALLETNNYKLLNICYDNDFYVIRYNKLQFYNVKSKTWQGVFVLMKHLKNSKLK